jgi:hypothetical protein
MANAERGEVDLINGEDRLTLALSMNAICEMQTRTGKTYGELLYAMPLDMLAFREMVFMALRRYHAKQYPNLSSVGDLLDALPDGHTTARKAMTALLELNAERGNAKRSADPQLAQV